MIQTDLSIIIEFSVIFNQLLKNHAIFRDLLKIIINKIK